jgi:hypothetical protein
LRRGRPYGLRTIVSIVLFPHLPLRSQARVGEWLLAPLDRFDQEEPLDDRRRVLDGLLDLYNLADSSPCRHGAVVRRAHERGCAPAPSIEVRSSATVHSPGQVPR